MQLYLDTGSVADIRRWLPTGVVAGVTTNPTLIAQEKRDFEETIRAIVTAFGEAGIADFTVSAEVTTLVAPEMVAQARRLAAIDAHVVVKIPLTVEGVCAISTLAKEGIKTNATLCFCVNQALLAATAGAAFVSPFVGRLDDAGEDGIGLLRRIRAVYDTHRLPTKLLAASIRNVEQVVAAAEAGADVATIPPAVFAKLFDHPLTDAGLRRFMDDWARR